MRTPRRLLLSATALIGLVAPSPARAEPPAPAPVVTQLVTGLASGSGSTVGPDGALSVTEGATGTVLRVDPDTGEVTTFASGLPSSIIGIGGAMDIVFIGGTAYVLVTLHRPAVVDGPLLDGALAALAALREQMPVVFPVHPRTRKRNVDPPRAPG